MERLEPLRDFYSSRVEGSWFLDTLCVVKSYRRRGIGRRLISLTADKTATEGCNILRLIVFADNTRSLPLYRRTGFSVVKTIKLQRNEYMKSHDVCYLMKREVSS